MQPKLKPAGVETLGVVNTTLDRARLYFKFRPTKMPLAVDPEAATHRAYGVPQFQIGEFRSLRVNPTGELPEALPGLEVVVELDRRDGFQMTEVDQQILAAHATQATGHFFIDREGTIRWTYIEAWKGIADLAILPTENEILAAAAALDLTRKETT